MGREGGDECFKVHDGGKFIDYFLPNRALTCSFAAHVELDLRGLRLYRLGLSTDARLLELPSHYFSAAVGRVARLESSGHNNLAPGEGESPFFREHLARLD
jgi:hypothetical protein